MISELTQQETLELVERFDEVVSKNCDLDGIGEVVAEDSGHPASFQTPQGREGFTQIIAQFARTFPDASSTTKHTIVQGDKVALPSSFLGRVGASPTKLQLFPTKL